ncbi:cell wall / vacuolar inhibitor of fructosidase 1-like precursor [Cicer arietinum]|uniref:Cell wall / vacuolar inhibitor of fructosidase 1-like precursor n=1 Tax=Cicer arietinum TaxID=3827 RepID=A0A3Q7K7F1_CICAR|nr:cell wall / vacuolar inhibitor of fructosidase 1-like precursor [Cicer arietinum]
MTKLKPLALLAIILYTLIVTSHSTNPKSNTNLIHQTCKHTPNYAICIKYLEADPRSSTSDVTGLALIMVDVIKTKANSSLNKIKHLIKGTHEPNKKEALNSCGGRYRAIVEADVPKCVAALKEGDPKFAEDGANDAAIEATACENGFFGKSPLSDDNIAMQDVAAITATIVKQLL